MDEKNIENLEKLAQVKKRMEATSDPETSCCPPAETINIPTPDESEVCVWELDYNFYYPGCGFNYSNEFPQYTPHDKDFKFCPFCGKPIEVKGK